MSGPESEPETPEEEAAEQPPEEELELEQPEVVPVERYARQHQPPRDRQIHEPGRDR